MIEPVDLTQVRFDPEALFTELIAGGVEFIVIGGVAAILHGDAAGTEDTDLTVRRTGDNLQRLATVLTAINGRLLVVLNDRELATVNTAVTAETFGPLTSARFLTDLGVLDVVLQPDGVPDYGQWAAHATAVKLSTGVEVQVAALDDIITSKEAANRPKDAYALPRLRALREMIGERD
jgi:hypothetical protein